MASEKLSRDERHAAGWALLAVGALTTIPLVINVITKPKHERELAAQGGCL